MARMPHKIFTPADMSLKERHQLLIGGVAPRPIAFVGTLDADGNPNLAPFSFFNAFGANPVTIGISPAYSGRTGEPKDTMVNIKATGQFTVSIVNFGMVRQMQLTAGEYPPEVNEFEISGFTPSKSVAIDAPGVSESPFIMECELESHIDLGGDKGSGNLLLGRVLRYHISDDILDEKGRIDPVKLDPVGRLNAGWYTRAITGLFSIDRLQTDHAIGFGALPQDLLTSTVLTGNDLALLAGVGAIPESTPIPGEMRQRYNALSRDERHGVIKGLVEAGSIDEAWSVVLSAGADD